MLSTFHARIRSVRRERSMQMRQHALCMSHVAVSLLSSPASQDIQELNKVEESMNN